MAFLLLAHIPIRLDAAPAQPGGCVEILRSGELPESVEWAMDVRWAGEQSVFLSQRLRGVFEWALGSPAAVLWAQRGHGRGQVYLPDQMATTAKKLIVASTVFAFGIGNRQGQGFDMVFPMEELLDLDANGEQLVVYGSQRDAKGNYAPEGALAWLGSVGQDPSLWKPLFLSESGPGMPSFARCGKMEIGAVRFLADGSIFLVPGVEGGAYLYSSDGKLERTFLAEQLGIDSGCPLDQEQADFYAMDQPGRWVWVNGRRVVDDIVPLPGGSAGVIVREYRDGRPQFKLRVLRSDGSWRSCALPIETEIATARLKADVRGQEIFFLLTQQGHIPFAATVTDLRTGKQEQIPPRHHPDHPSWYFVTRYVP